MKKILVLGGSRLMGRMLVEQLETDNRYQVTLFNRGKTNPELFPSLRRIIGDRRTDDIRQIEKEDWDTIIDFSSYHPKYLKPFVERISGKVGRYIYISTVSTYDNDALGVKPETAPLQSFTEELIAEETITGKNYGAKKVACEQILLEQKDLDKIILRPSIVYGQYDYTERLYYWLYRVKTQAKFIVPDKGEELSNFTFVNDVVDIILAAIELKEHRTIYNTTTHSPNSWNEKIGVMKKLLGTNPESVFVPQAVLSDKSQDIKLNFPGWRTNDNLRYDHSKLLADFPITLISFEESIKKMIQYHNEQNLWEEGSAGTRLKDELNFINNVL